MASGGGATTGSTTGEKCGVCVVEVKSNEKALQCDICSVWVHSKCAKVPDALYNNIIKSGKDCVGVKWFCDKCEPQFEKIKTELNGLKEKQKEMEFKQTSIETAVKELGKEWSEMKKMCEKWKTEIDKKSQDGQQSVNEDGIEELKEEVRSLKKSYSEIVETNRVEGAQVTTNVSSNRAMQMEVSEALEREKRKNNLVIFGLQETGDEFVTRDKVKEIVNVVGIEEGKVRYFGRVGRVVAGGKPRVVRIICEDVETKRSFLKGANRLKETEGYERVYISQDLTKAQQLKDKKLRDKLREIRSTHREAKINNEEIIIFESGSRKVLFSLQN